MTVPEKRSASEVVALIVVAVCWMTTIVATCFAAVSLFAGLREANGAPQQAAAAAMSAAMVVIPYVFTRSVQSLCVTMWRR